MQSGVRAVEAYRRAVLIDGATSDNDSVAPVYKLEEICTLMRTSSLDIVRELVERILKRMDHKSPIVKQKALRLIKFAAGKAGVEFRREIQRQAPAVRNLLHYRGAPDALKGDALNKAVRETAQEALSAIFASNDKPPAEEVGKRMEGFGSTNFDSSTRGVKKSMLDDVMGFGSSTIRQMSGLASSGSSGNYGNSSSSSYRGPNLRRSLTDRESKYNPSDSQVSTYSLSSNETFESRDSKTESSGGGSPRHEGRPMTQEDRLVEVVTTPGGVRLQPSREVVQNFLTAAAKLDGDRLGYALQSKLQAHAWQARFKAMCIVEAILRQGDSNDVLQRVVGMFQEDSSCIVENSQSPQASLKEKSKKVLELLGLGGSEESQHKSGSGPNPPPLASQQAVVLPDLMDGWDAPEGVDDVQSTGKISEQVEVLINGGGGSSASAAADDLLGGFGWNATAKPPVETTRAEDPFAGLSLHTASTPSSGDGLFSGLRVDAVDSTAANGTSDYTGFFEGLTIGGDDSTTAKQAQPSAESLVDLFGGLSTTTSVDPFQDLASSSASKPSLANGTSNPGQLDPLAWGNTSKQLGGNGQIDLGQLGTSSVGGALPSQMMYMNPALLMQMAGGTMQPNMPPQGFAPGPASFAGMSPLMMQQQLAANLASMQALGIGMSFPAGAVSQGNGVPTSSFGQNYNDGFDFSNPSGPKYSTEPKKEETKAFDWLKLS
ncbi:protein MODIFIED TRANSPORT TO THE VACUOLE 1 [Physcomitrium patens]|uniref:VHS domain-containing protein n=1 Tax=Physcomitrium patens TaxID=3218 RepID=A0A2K1L1Z7_PHYPA|nr:VHS domain-containing protein At3g16270-like [Physcomitrium patens]PNR60033.1 hypothetical protein PHYPA_002826 [Physcomitrium patens]|eukprot:XP_024368366.1 VHS domain-containing protein At3g16270-like [Physcomitrella patens]